MLVSPIRVYDLLSGVLEPSEDDGPHTALLITPPGELISYSTLPEDDAGDSETSGEELDDEVPGDELEEAIEDVQAEEEPYLEGPERLRLLLGLASQWEDDESPRVECELGRLFLRPIPLPELEPHNALLPTVKPPVVNSFILVLNGTAATPWSKLAQKADDFVANW